MRATKSNEKGNKTLMIGQVAKLSGIGIETIRFYEREGLVEEPARRESGYREYTADVVTRLTLSLIHI